MKSIYAWKPWSEAEDSVVRALYIKYGPALLSTKMPGRTPEAIRVRAKKLGIRKGNKPWTMADEVTLAKLYPDHTSNEIAVIMGRSAKAIQFRASKMALTKRGKRRDRDTA